MWAPRSQSFQKGPSVSRAEHPAVQDDDDAPVGPIPDQAAEPLSEPEDGLGHGVVEEGVFALLFQLFRGFERGIYRSPHGQDEGQVDDEAVLEEDGTQEGDFRQQRDGDDGEGAGVVQPINVPLQKTSAYETGGPDSEDVDGRAADDLVHLEGDGKRGMDGVLRVLAREVGPHGITVNQVAPGWTITENVPDSDAARPYQEQVPLGRRGTDQEIANVVTFLASDLASFISGAYVPVCGGNVMPTI